VIDGPGQRYEQEGEPRVVIRDKRRIDPESGEVRTPDLAAGTEQPAAARAVDVSSALAADSAVAAAEARVGELTETLQRLKAEYDNYRRRAERDRAALVEVATGSVLSALLPILDDLERARAHGDLTGAFGSVGEALIGVTAKLGLEPYGESGEPFDPQVHEAVMQAPPAEGSDIAVVAEVFRPGYRHAGRSLRPAQVSVSEPGLSPVSVADEPQAEDIDGAADEETTPSA
jgi:molecular chaperone GrpE